MRVTKYYRALRERRRLRDVDAPLESAIQDFNLEAAFAERYLAGEVELTDFQYYQSYVRTIESESQLMGKPSQILFVGSGPVPLSAILFARKFPQARIDVLDVDQMALITGAAVASKAGVFFGRQIAVDAAKFPGYGRYDTVVLSMEAGPTDETKRAVLHNLFWRIGSDTLVLLRGSRTPQFVQTRLLLPEDVMVTGEVSTFDGQGETLAIRKVTG